MTKLRYDKKLLARLSKRRDPDVLSLADKIAINLAWRDRARIPILAKLYGVSKNTIYYKCISGDAASYPSGETNTAAEINAIIDRIGVEAAFETYLTDEHVKRTNLALKKTLEAETRKKREQVGRGAKVVARPGDPSEADSGDQGGLGRSATLADCTDGERDQDGQERLAEGI